MNLIKYIFSKAFVRTLVKAGLFALLLVALAWVFLRFYTKHAEKVVVPKVEGMILSEAISKLKESTLSYKLIDSTFVKGKAGIVYAQIPTDSSFVKSEREIYLKVYRTIPPQKPVRFKVGEPLEIAKTKMLSKGFEIETKYQPGEFNNVVLGAYYGEKELKDGDLVGMGEKIKLVVSERKSTKVSLPNLYGMSLDEVKSSLGALSLNLDFPLYDASVISKSDTLNAQVFKQMPKYLNGKKIRAGSAVNVWLKLGVEAPVEDVPNVD
ncbi:MAG: PASTA domain-containing protein [Flavobacteriales bacterium]